MEVSTGDGGTNGSIKALMAVSKVAEAVSEAAEVPELSKTQSLLLQL